MTIGIYKLKFQGTDNVYIGQSKNIEYRLSSHIRCLRNGTSAQKLLAAYKKYGEPSCEILCECSIQELNKLENEAIEIFDSYNNGFNTFRQEGGSIRGASGLQHPNSKYSKITILKIFSLLYRTLLTYSSISKRVKVPVNIVNNIATGTHHLWLQDIYPEKFSVMITNGPIRNRTNVKSYGYENKTHKPLISPTGDIYTNILNISEFCRTHPLLKDGCESTRSSIAKVLKGTKISHKGWHLAI